MGQNTCKPLGSTDACKSTTEAVCVHTKKIYDSCKDKDCEENLRVWLTRESQCVLDRATGVKPRSAELLTVAIDVEPVAFNRGYYAVNARYFYKVCAEVACGVGRPVEISGVATFSKRAMLYGGEGSAKIFTSELSDGALRTNMPTAVVETVEPIVLDIKLVEVCGCGFTDACCDLPTIVCDCFDDEIMTQDGEKRLYVTLGQFSLIRLERDSQLLIPAYDFCVPDKECSCSSEESPCDLFGRICFPTEEFFPLPQCKE